MVALDADPGTEFTSPPSVKSVPGEAGGTTTAPVQRFPGFGGFAFGSHTRGNRFGAWRARSAIEVE